MKRVLLVLFVFSVVIAQGAGAPQIRREARPWGADYTLEACDGSNDVVLVSVRPKCVKYESQMANMYSDDAYGVAVRAWDLRDEMTQGNGELRVVVKGGRVGAVASVIEGPRDELGARLAAAGKAHGAALNLHGGPLVESSDLGRLSYMFTEITRATAEDYVEHARRSGIGVIHFHGWWASLGHYPVKADRFPKGIADMRAATDLIHAAGLHTGMHTLSGCIDFKDPCLATPKVRELQRIARYTLAAPLGPDGDAVTVRERPSALHDRTMTYSGNGNVLRIGDELVQYSDFTTNAPYRFTGLVRGWCGSPKAPHAAGEAADYLHQRYLSFYPEPGSPLADEVAQAIAAVFNGANMDQVYFDGSEGMGSRYAIDWMRDRMFRALGRPAIVEASCKGKHNWYFHSRLNAWDFGIWSLKSFVDRHVAVNATTRLSDLQIPQMGWWAPIPSGRVGSGYHREDTEYCAGKAAAIDASFSVQGIREYTLWKEYEHMTILGWYERFRTTRAFTAEALAALAVRGDEHRLRPDRDGRWTLTPVRRVRRRAAGGEAWTRTAVRGGAAALRVEALYDAKADETGIVMLEGGKAGRTWAYPYLDISGHEAFAFDVKGDGSGRTLVLTVETPREFSRAFSQHVLKVDFTGWRKVAFLARERDADAIPNNLGYAPPFRNGLDFKHISAVSLAWADGKGGAPEASAVRAVPVAETVLRHPTLAVNGRTVEVPFDLKSGEWAELEDGRWTQYAPSGEAVRRAGRGEFALEAGENRISWTGPGRAEVTTTEFGEPLPAIRPDASPEFVYLMPQRLAPKAGFDGLDPVPVAAGERRQLRLELVGRIRRPTLVVDGERFAFPVDVGRNERLLCLDGSSWQVVGPKRASLASGRLERPLPVLTKTAEVSLESVDPENLDVTVLLSTQTGGVWL